MPFWGIVLEPGKPYTLQPDKTRGKLRITQASLGDGTSLHNCRVQCSVGGERPVVICVLIHYVSELCQLNFEFEEDDPVVFSVTGERTAHLSGYFVGSGNVIDPGAKVVAQIDLATSKIDTNCSEDKQSSGVVGDSAKRKRGDMEKDAKNKNIDEDSKTNKQRVDVKVTGRQTFPSGLISEDLAAGKTDGKKAFKGKKVWVHFTWNLKDGEVFGKSKDQPIKFRLGKGAFMKGCNLKIDSGVEGMRVGDIRRLTVPRSLCNMKKRQMKMPQGSKFVLDVELMDVE